jgi:UDP-2,4-diacetamido-2,4,6-trideoxy-beta-L-altropyranose hydrolase
MRCLTLADALSGRGDECSFISRDHIGNQFDLIEKRGFPIHVLPRTRGCSTEIEARSESVSEYLAWLGADWEVDAQQTLAYIHDTQTDWLIVDHYSLDARWEKLLRPHCKKLLAIDDLANRKHVCDVLLDQNLGRKSKDYDTLVPDHCIRLIGPQNALLLPDFASLRDYSLQRRKDPILKRILIAMGGVDQPNATGKVLEALMDCQLSADCNITVVMGGKAPWIEQVRAIAANMPWPTEVRIDITDMARIMADSDLSIGSAGITSWERCCMGLPALLVVLADNQKLAALNMSRTGVSHLLHLDQTLASNLQHFIRLAVYHPNWLKVMSIKSSEVTEGNGSKLVINAMMYSGKI